MSCRGNKATCQSQRSCLWPWTQAFPCSLPDSLGPGTQSEETQEIFFLGGGFRVLHSPAWHRYINRHEEDARFWDNAVLDTAPCGEGKAFCTACAHRPACSSALPRQLIPA